MPEQENGTRPLPNPARLLPTKIRDKKNFLWGAGFVGVGLVFLLARNDAQQQQAVMGPKPNPAVQPAQTNPLPSQIHDWQSNLQAAEKQYQAAQQFQQQQAAALATPPQPIPTQPMTMADLNAAQSAQSGQLGVGNARGGGYAGNGAGTSRDASKDQERQRAYQSLFSDNVIHQERTQPVSFSSASPATRPERTEPVPTETASEQTPAPHRKALDFDPAQHQTYWLPEGTVLEAVLTNRLDGEQPGPVNVMFTTDVYLPGTRLLLLPQGTRVLGEASKVSAFGQQRLAVAFHRALVPGLHQYTIPMDKAMPGLSQAGETGLHDKVNNHYASIFGASLAIGAIGGLAQLGNGQIGFGYDPGVQFRNGISQSMAQSADRVLDRFLNRMPTILIREGTRVKIVLTDDWQVPGYDDMTKGEF